jgi:hypothetical protein
MVRVALTGVAALLIVCGGIAQGAPIPPTVTGDSASQVTADDATLEASIDTGGGAAGVYYQFQISEFPAEFPDDLRCPPPPSSGPFLPCNGPATPGVLPIGHLAHSGSATTVALDLADAGMTLEPGATYYFRVVAATAVQSEDTIKWEGPVATGEERTLTTSAASSPPSITGEAVSHLSDTDAILEASIDASAGTYYQFQFSEFPVEFPDEMSCPPPPVLGLPACVGPQSDAALPIGYLDGSGEVALRLSEAGVTLRPGATYYFRVLAADAKQTEDSVEWETPVVSGELRAFTTQAQLVEPAQGASGGAAADSQVASAGPVVHRHHRRHHRHHHGHMRAAAIALASIAR